LETKKKRAAALGPGKEVAEKNSSVGEGLGTKGRPEGEWQRVVLGGPMKMNHGESKEEKKKPSQRVVTTGTKKNKKKTTQKPQRKKKAGKKPP